jgi:class 3 adenylate cyclase
VQTPDTEYARAGDIRIAYHLFGEGPTPIVWSGGPAGHIEVFWEEPSVQRWNERLASFGRVAMFDRRGTGASDPADGPPTLEQYGEDLLAVMDACGFERAAVLGGSEAGRMAAQFAAEHPERVSALVLTGVSAKGAAVLEPGLVEALEQIIESSWGRGDIVRLYAPSMVGDERFQRWAGRLERHSVSPRGARDILRISIESDITEALPRIAAPTLVLHRRDDALVPVAAGREVAEAIPGARFVELEGVDNMGWVGDADAVLDEMEEFLTGRLTARRRGRALATVLFTDIVGSTELAARLSDRRWRDLLGEHDRMVRREIERAAGSVVKSTGDGFLATFASPTDGVRAARAAAEAVRGLGLTIRAGVHTGEVELMDGDVGGLAVHIAARIAALAEPEEVLVSGTVRDILVGSGLRLEPRGRHVLKGVPDEWPVFGLA